MHLCTASREFVHPVHVDYRDNNKVIAKYHLKFAGFTTSHPARRPLADVQPAPHPIGQ
jgi:hypothetical protein